MLLRWYYYSHTAKGEVGSNEPANWLLRVLGLFDWDAAVMNKLIDSHPTEKPVLTVGNSVTVPNRYKPPIRYLTFPHSLPQRRPCA